MSFALGVAGPSRRLATIGGRIRLRSPVLHHVARRQVQTSSSINQQAWTKPRSSDDQTLAMPAPDTSSSSNDGLDSVSHVRPDGNPPERAHVDASDLKDDLNLGPSRPSSTSQQDGNVKPKPGPDPTKQPSTQLNIPWQIPPAWRSKLDPNAPWRKSLLESRRRWSEQAGQQLSAVGLKLNEVTGYKEVERLKEVVNEKEIRLKWLREDAKTAKEEYERAVSTRATSQSDVNSLLERKHTWTDEDVSRFTQLVRSDHLSNQAVATTSLTLKETELGVDRAFNELMQAILQRYHEEQVWSDKIRNVSTYANLLGLLINLVVFVGAIAFVEPWKRRRLVERLEERMAGMMDRVEASIGVLGEKVGSDIKSIREEAQTFSGISPPTTERSQLVTDKPELLADTDLFTTNTDINTEIDDPLHFPLPNPSRGSSALSQTMDRLHLSTLLDKVAPPSHDRDVVFSASVGAVAGIAITALGMWMGR